MSTLQKNTFTIGSDSYQKQLNSEQQDQPTRIVRVAMNSSKIHSFTWDTIPHEEAQPKPAETVSDKPGFFRKLFGQKPDAEEQDTTEHISHREEVREREIRQWIKNFACDTSSYSSIFKASENDLGSPPSGAGWNILHLVFFGENANAGKTSHPAFQYANEQGLVPATLYQTAALSGMELADKLSVDFFYLFATQPIRGSYAGYRINRDQYGENRSSRVLKSRDLSLISLDALKGDTYASAFCDPDVTDEKLLDGLVSQQELYAESFLPR